MKIVCEIGRNTEKEMLWGNICEEFKTCSHQIVMLNGLGVGNKHVMSLLKIDATILNEHLFGSGFGEFTWEMHGTSSLVMKNSDGTKKVYISYDINKISSMTDVLHMFEPSAALQLKCKALTEESRRKGGKWYVYTQNNTMFCGFYYFKEGESDELSFRYNSIPDKPSECIGCIGVCKECGIVSKGTNRMKNDNGDRKWTCDVETYVPNGFDAWGMCSRRVRDGKGWKFLVNNDVCPLYAEHFVRSLN